MSATCATDGCERDVCKASVYCGPCRIAEIQLDTCGGSIRSRSREPAEVLGVSGPTGAHRIRQVHDVLRVLARAAVGSR